MWQLRLAVHPSKNDSFQAKGFSTLRGGHGIGLRPSKVPSSVPKTGEAFIGGAGSLGILELSGTLSSVADEREDLDSACSRCFLKM